MLEFMKHLARQAGAMACSDSLHLKDENIHTKGTVLDLVTDTDRKVEEFINGELQRRFPAYGIYGEETGKSHADREFCFIIDPIDGTTSFIHGLPNWCVSIGLFRRGRPYAGVIYQPATDELYYAEQGQGAFLNGLRLHVSRHQELSECVVATGFACLRARWREETNLKFLPRIVPLVAGLRRFGSAALDCCLTARGSLDAYWEMNLQPYDVAAGMAILQEAGGTVTDLRGGERCPDQGILCTNGILHSRMLEFFTDFQDLKR